MKMKISKKTLAHANRNRWYRENMAGAIKGKAFFPISAEIAFISKQIELLAGRATAYGEMRLEAWKKRLAIIKQ